MLLEATPTFRGTGSILNVASMKLELLYPEGHFSLFSWPGASCGGAQSGTQGHSYAAGALSHVG